MNAPRCLALWIPDWPVFAAFGADTTEGAECAVIHDNFVVACSASARAQGVRRGQRRRVAQSLCPSLRFLPADPGRDERAFRPLLRLLEERVPGVQLLRPGLASVRARGAARYYGGEEQAARVLLSLLAEHGHADACAGVADGLFAAEQAARRAELCLVIAPGGSGAFLGPLPVALLGDDELASLLRRLGVHSMAQFARLTESDVRGRLGERGVHLRALAAGEDPRPFTAHAIEDDLAQEVVFETPLTQADQVGFAVRQAAEAVILALDAAGTVCTEVRIDLGDDRGAGVSRTWQHPTCFDAADLVDRVRWQLEGGAEHFSAGIVSARLTPTQTDDAAHHQPGLFGQGRQERMHHGLSRVQALLGHDAVTIGAISGGRLLADRQSFTPWGDRTLPARPPDRPWPGLLPPPLPGEVFTPPREVEVTASDRSPLTVDPRGALSAPPAQIAGVGVLSWAGPWPVRDRSWDAKEARLVHRLQIVDERQRAWVVLCDDEGWWAEGVYR